MMNICFYYQAQIVREQTWFFTAALRSLEHMAFDRTIDKGRGILEFFVPESMHALFERFMHDMQAQHVVVWLRALPNRLQDPQAEV